MRDVRGDDRGGAMGRSRTPTRPPPLYERTRELRALARHRREVQSGAGRFVYLHGEAGVGKSELLRRSAREAHAAGFTVCSARAAELERGWTFGVARQVVTDLLENSADPEAVLAGAGAIARGLLEPP